MKDYIKPMFEFILLTSEEKFASGSCHSKIGACHDKATGEPIYYA